jgi:hypothetical protein
MALSEYYLQRTVLAAIQKQFLGLVTDLSSDRVSHENMPVHVTLIRKR